MGQRQPCANSSKSRSPPLQLDGTFCSPRPPGGAAEDVRAAAATAPPAPLPTRPGPCSALAVSPGPVRSPGPGSARPLATAGVTLCLPRRGPGGKPSRRYGVLHQGRVPGLRGVGGKLCGPQGSAGGGSHRPPPRPWLQAPNTPSRLRWPQEPRSRIWKRLEAHVPPKPPKFLPETVFMVGKLRHSRLASCLSRGCQTQGTCACGAHAARAWPAPPAGAYLHGRPAAGPDPALESQSFQLTLQALDLDQLPRVLQHKPFLGTWRLLTKIPHVNLKDRFKL